MLLPPRGEPIADCISVCDVWSAYDSTTCMEAWLLGKPSLLINPSGADFPRASMYLGSPIFQTHEEVTDALQTHRVSGDLPGFAAKDEVRQELVTDTIQWADGKNHLRAAHHIERLLNAAGQRPRNPSRLERLDARRHDLLYRGAARAQWAPGFRNYSGARSRFDRTQLREAAVRAERVTAVVADGLSAHELTELEEMNR